MRTSILFVLGLSMAFAPCSIAEPSPQDAAMATAALAGSVVGLTEIMTRSSLVVKVEMYQDTASLYADPYEGRRFPVEERRSQPFRLGKPAAMQKLLENAQSGPPTMAAFSRVHGSLMPRIQKIHEMGVHVRKQGEKYSNIEGPGWQKVAEDHLKQANAADAVGVAWTAFDACYSDAKKRGLCTTADRERMGELLKALLDKLMDAQSFDSLDRLSDAWFNLLGADLTGKSRLVGVPPAETEAVRIACTSTAKGSAKLADILYAAYNLEQRHPELDKDFEAVYRDFGINVPEDWLVPVPSRASLEVVMEKVGGIDAIMITLEAAQAGATVYANLLTSANLGPIVNEMTQGILAMNAPLDEITDEKNEARWVVTNVAYSKGRTGNHNTIIYLDNTATPIIKKATFNPDEFIKANGAMFQTAFNTAVNLFGMPAASTTDKEGDTTSTNLFDLRARLAAAKRDEQISRQKRIQALSQLVTHFEKVDRTKPEQTDLDATKQKIAEIAALFTTSK